MGLMRRLVLIPIALCLVFTVLPVLPLMAQTTVTGGGAASSVSSAAFPLLAPDGTIGAPSYSWSSTPTQRGWFNSGTGSTGFTSWVFNNGLRLEVANSGFFTRSDAIFGFYASTTPGGTPDTTLERVAAGVIGATGGSTSTEGWLQNESGDQFLTADHTNSTATPTNLTDLTVNVTTGRKYVCNMTLMVSQSTAADGARVDFEGGTATATNFRANVTILDGTAYDTHTSVTALATDVTSTDIGTTVLIEARGLSFEPSSTGTFIPRVGLEAASTGTITTFRGSSLTCKDMP